MGHSVAGPGMSARDTNKLGNCELSSYAENDVGIAVVPDKARDTSTS